MCFYVAMMSASCDVLSHSLTIGNDGSGLVLVEDDGVLDESSVVEVFSFSGLHSVNFLDC